MDTTPGKTVRIAKELPLPVAWGWVPVVHRSAATGETGLLQSPCQSRNFAILQYGRGGEGRSKNPTFGRCQDGSSETKSQVRDGENNHDPILDKKPAILANVRPKSPNGRSKPGMGGRSPEEQKPRNWRLPVLAGFHDPAEHRRDGPRTCTREVPHAARKPAKMAENSDGMGTTGCTRGEHNRRLVVENHKQAANTAMGKDTGLGSDGTGAQAQNAHGLARPRG